MKAPTRKRLREALEVVFADTYRHVNDMEPMTSDVDQFVDSYLQEYIDASRSFVAKRLY